MKRLVGFLFFYIIISMLFGCFFDNSSDEQKTSENGFDIEGFTKIETYQKLTQEDVDLLTSSQIIYANLSNWVSLAINEKSNELEIEIPSYVKWDNAYDEDGNLTKTGELWNLVQVLNIEAFQTDGTFDINKLVDINSISKLTERDSTVITTSKIILMNIDKIINKCFIEKNDLSLSIPKGIIWENSVTADGTIERAGEFLNIVNVLKIKAFNDENGFNVDKFNINGFKELTKEDTNVLLDSRIFSISINDIMSDIFEGDPDFYLPTYVRWENGEEFDGELWKMVQILNLLNPVEVSISDIQALSADDKGVENTDLLTSSAIIMANIERMLEKATKDTSVVIPNGVIWNNSYKNTELAKKGELLLLVEFLNIKSFQDVNGFNANLVALDNINYNDIKSYIDDSLIIRATTSKLIVDAIHHEHFEIPCYDDSSKSIFDNENYLIPSEIHAFLEAGDLVGLIYNQNSSKHLISSDVNNLANNIDKILSSAILHRMLSQEIMLQNIVPSNLVILDQYITKEELKNLFNGLKVIDIKGDVIESIALKDILSFDEAIINDVIKSNILSYVFSKKIIESGYVDDSLETIDILIYNIDNKQSTYNNEKLLLAIKNAKVSL